MKRKALSMFAIEVIIVVAVIAAAGILIAINLPKPESGKLVGPPIIIQPNTTQPAPSENISANVTAAGNVTANITENLTAPEINGLKGEYFSNIDFSGDVYTRTDSVVDMAWKSQEAPIEGISGARFSARWTGKLMIEQAGDYMFVITSDDGSRLYINGVKQADLWDNSGVNSKSATMALTAGKHDIKIEYKNLGGGLAKIKLEYIASRLGIERQVVPSEKLSPE